MEDAEQAIDEFMGESPRAMEWRGMRQALADRLRFQRRQRAEEAEAGVDARRLASLDTQIATLERDVAALETEEAVAQFVEDSIRMTVAKSALEIEEEI